MREPLHIILFPMIKRTKAKTNTFERVNHTHTQLFKRMENF